MEAKEIIRQLCDHEITRLDAELLIIELVNAFRSPAFIEGEVESISHTITDNHGFIKIMLPYNYEAIDGRLKQGDKIDFIIRP